GRGHQGGGGGDQEEIRRGGSQGRSQVGLLKVRSRRHRGCPGPPAPVSRPAGSSLKFETGANQVEQNVARSFPNDPLNFSKIQTSIAIPNLIEVQKQSYERFLQMYTAPTDREDTGLQAVFKSIFPISDFRGTSSLEFEEFSIGNWECKCGKLEGLQHLRMACVKCGKKIAVQNPKVFTVACPDCGHLNDNRISVCDICGDPVSLKFKYDVQECQERGMTYTVPLKVKIRLKVFEK